MKKMSISEKTKGAMERLFKELVLDRIEINNPGMNHETFPWCVFWIAQDGIYVCHYNWEEETFRLNNSVFWKLFEVDEELIDKERLAFMSDMVKKYFGLTSASVVPSSVMFSRMRKILA